MYLHLHYLLQRGHSSSSLTLTVLVLIEEQPKDVVSDSKWRWSPTPNASMHSNIQHFYDDQTTLLCPQPRTLWCHDNIMSWHSTITPPAPRTWPSIPFTIQTLSPGHHCCNHHCCSTASHHPPLQLQQESPAFVMNLHIPSLPFL